MEIRKVEQTDNQQLATVIREAFREHNAPQQGTVYSDPTTDDLYTLFQTEGAVLWVAILDGKIAGCCGVYPTPGLPEHYVELAKFYLSPSARGKGIGKMLMQKSIESAAELGYTALYLESLPVFSSAIGMYEKIGFTMIDHPLGNSGHTSCDIWMVKKL